MKITHQGWVTSLNRIPFPPFPAKTKQNKWVRPSAAERRGVLTTLP